MGRCHICGKSGRELKRTPGAKLNRALLAVAMANTGVIEKFDMMTIVNAHPGKQFCSEHLVAMRNYYSTCQAIGWLDFSTVSSNGLCQTVTDKDRQLIADLLLKAIKNEQLQEAFKLDEESIGEENKLDENLAIPSTSADVSSVEVVVHPSRPEDETSEASEITKALEVEEVSEVAEDINTEPKTAYDIMPNVTNRESPRATIGPRMGRVKVYALPSRGESISPVDVDDSPPPKLSAFDAEQGPNAAARELPCMSDHCRCCRAWSNLHPSFKPQLPPKPMRVIPSSHPFQPNFRRRPSPVHDIDDEDDLTLGAPKKLERKKPLPKSLDELFNL